MNDSNEVKNTILNGDKKKEEKEKREMMIRRDHPRE